MKRRSVRRLFLSLGLAVLLLALLFAAGGVDPTEGLRTLGKLPVGTYLGALLLHLGTHALRALRFRILIPRPARPGFRYALSIAAAHNMASYVLPLKTGEAALVVYLKLQCATPVSISLAALLVSRFLDAAALCAGLAVACFALERSGAHPALTWLGPASLALVASTLAFVLLALRSDLLVRALGAGLRWLRLQRWQLGQRLLERLSSLALALRAASGLRRLGGATLATLPMWFTVVGFFFVLGRALGLPPELSLLECSFGAALATLFNLLPINAAAGVGTQELGWVTGFHEILDVPYDLALNTGIGVHLVQLFNVVALGLIAHLALGIMPRWRFDEPREGQP